LERRDRAVELHARLCVGERVLERTAGEPDGTCRGVDAGDVEAMERGVEGTLRLRRGALAQGADAVPRRHAQAVEPEVEGGEAEVPDLVDRLGAEPIRELAALLLDEERHEAASLRLSGLGIPLPAEEQDEVRVERIAAPALLAADDVVVARPLGAALDVGQVGARTRLGKRRRADPRAARAPAQELGPTLRVAHLRAHAVAPRDDARDAHPGPGQLLRDERVLEDAEAEAAVLAVDEDAEVAQLAETSEETVGNVGALAIELVGDGQHLLKCEPARPGLQLEPFRGEIPTGGHDAPPRRPDTRVGAP